APAPATAPPRGAPAATTASPSRRRSRALPAMKTCDVIVVGAGMLGVAHAWAAAKRGLSVAVIERSRQAHGATVRNFGQVIVTGQPPGMMLSHAQQARELWLDLAAKAGFHVRANGALVLARNADEADVLQEFADTRLHQEGYRAQLLS